MDSSSTTVRDPIIFYLLCSKPPLLFDSKPVHLKLVGYPVYLPLQIIHKVYTSNPVTPSNPSNAIFFLNFIANPIEWVPLTLLFWILFWDSL